MNNKFNMAFAALLVAGLIAMFSGLLSRQVVHAEKLHEDAVKVEVAEASASAGSAKVAMPEPILGLIATADIERGKGVAKACAACHSFDNGGPNGVGPNLYGVVGAKKQAHAGYSYSGELNKTGGDVWTYAELNKFLWKPKAYASGTKMNFIGVKKAEDRAALVAYLASLNGHAAPTQAEIDAEAKELGGGDAAATPAPAAPADPAKEEPKAH